MIEEQSQPHKTYAAIKGEATQRRLETREPWTCLKTENLMVIVYFITLKLLHFLNPFFLSSHIVFTISDSVKYRDYKGGMEQNNEIHNRKQKELK